MKKPQRTICIFLAFILTITININTFALDENNQSLEELVSNMEEFNIISENTEKAGDVNIVEEKEEQEIQEIQLSSTLFDEHMSAVQNVSAANINVISISSINDLSLIKNNLASSYELTADIDLQNNEWSPIGTKDAPFKGKLYGNGYTISNFSVNSQLDYVGLFGYIDNAQIEDVNILNCNIIGKSNVGGLIGYAKKSTVINCQVLGSGSIKGDAKVGGLIGMKEYGNLYKCNSEITVTGTDSTGGLIGDNSGEVELCHSTGAVSGSINIGGLIGYARGEGTINKNYSASNIKAIGKSDRLGGLIGRIASNKITVKNSFSSGDINGLGECGGLVGYSTTAAMENCYFNGTIAGEKIGGITPSSSLIVTNSYFNSDKLSVQTPTDQSRTGLNLLNKSTYSGWDFVDTWEINNDSAYPYIKELGIPNNYYNPQFEVDNDEITMIGDGTAVNPYQVTSKEELKQLEFSGYNEYFLLMNDLDLRYELWTPIENFVGNFDGNGYKIKNLKIDLPNKNDVGLFAGNDNRITLMNVVIENVDIKGKDYVGGLAGKIKYSSIENCAVIGEGQVSGNKSVGGLLGGINSGYITECHTTVNVEGSSMVGGLIGNDMEYELNVARCYTTGNTTGIDCIGGLIGFSYLYEPRELSQCYTIGRVSGDSNVGGLIGMAFGEGDMQYYYTNIVDCFSFASVNGDKNVGGFMGNTNTNYGMISIEKGYYSGELSGHTNIGGLVGGDYDYENDEIIFVNSYFNSDTTSITIPESQARTPHQLTQTDTFVDWDFDNVWIILNGMPYLRNVPLEGLPEGDLYEPNNSFEEATAYKDLLFKKNTIWSSFIGTATIPDKKTFYENGFFRAKISHFNDKDYYALDVGLNKDVSSSTECYFYLKNLPRDYDMYLYDSDMQTICASDLQTGISEEFFYFTPKKAGRYYVVIDGKGSFSNEEYFLSYGSANKTNNILVHIDSSRTARQNTAIIMSNLEGLVQPKATVTSMYLECSYELSNDKGPTSAKIFAHNSGNTYSSSPYTSLAPFEFKSSQSAYRSLANELLAQTWTFTYNCDKTPTSKYTPYVRISYQYKVEKDTLFYIY